jgi:hypothetical protein
MRTIKADALAKAAIQATARAMHTAQLSMDAYRRFGAGDPDAARRELLMESLRDALLEAYTVADDAERAKILATSATITSDELIDLLAMCVKG